MSDDEIKDKLIEHFAGRLENYFNQEYRIIDISYLDDDQYSEVNRAKKYDGIERIRIKIKDKKSDVIETGIFTVCTKGKQLYISACETNWPGVEWLEESITYMEFYSKGYQGD